MLLGPCGHTICRMCTRSRDDCPVCHCTVTSTTFNILLQQIVIDYRNKQAVGGAVPPDVNRAKMAATQSGVTIAKEAARRHESTDSFAEGRIPCINFTLSQGNTNLDVLQTQPKFIYNYILFKTEVLFVF